MNYEAMDYTVAAALAEELATSNDTEGLRNFLIAFEGAKLDLALKTRKFGATKSSLNEFFETFFEKFPLALN